MIGALVLGILAGADAPAAPPLGRLVARGRLATEVAAELRRVPEGARTSAAQAREDAARALLHDWLARAAVEVPVALSDDAPAGSDALAADLLDVVDEAWAARGRTVDAPHLRALSERCALLADDLAERRAVAPASVGAHRFEWRLRHRFPPVAHDDAALARCAGTLAECAGVLRSAHGLTAAEHADGSARVSAWADELLGYEPWSTVGSPDGALHDPDAVLADLLTAGPSARGVERLVDRLRAGLPESSSERASDEETARHLAARGLLAQIRERLGQVQGLDADALGRLAAGLPGLVEVRITILHEDEEAWLAIADPAWRAVVDNPGPDGSPLEVHLRPGPADVARVRMLGADGSTTLVRPSPLDHGPGHFRLSPGRDYLFDLRASLGGTLDLVLRADAASADVRLPGTLSGSHVVVVAPGTPDLVAVSNRPWSRHRMAERVHACAPKYIFPPDPYPQPQEDVYLFLAAFLADLPDVGDFDLRGPEDRAAALAFLDPRDPTAAIVPGVDAGPLRRVLRDASATRLPRAELCDWLEPVAAGALGWDEIGRGATHLRLDREPDPARTYVVREFQRLSRPR